MIEQEIRCRALDSRNTCLMITEIQPDRIHERLIKRTVGIRLTSRNWE